MSDGMERGAAWALGRRMPLALVVTVLIQAGSALIWAGATSARINELEAQGRERAGLEARTVRLEEQIGQVRATLERIERKLDRVGGTEAALDKGGRP